VYFFKPDSVGFEAGHHAEGPVFLQACCVNITLYHIAAHQHNLLDFASNVFSKVSDSKRVPTADESPPCSDRSRSLKERCVTCHQASGFMPISIFCIFCTTPREKLASFGSLLALLAAFVWSFRRRRYYTAIGNPEPGPMMVNRSTQGTKLY